MAEPDVNPVDRPSYSLDSQPSFFNWNQLAQPRFWQRVILNEPFDQQLSIREIQTIREEILLIIAHRQSDDLTELAESLRQQIAELDFASTPTGSDRPEKVCVTASLGLTEFGQDASDTFSRAFDRADQALYLAKRQGRNRIVVN